MAQIGSLQSELESSRAESAEGAAAVDERTSKLTAELEQARKQADEANSVRDEAASRLAGVEGELAQARQDLEATSEKLSGAAGEAERGAGWRSGPEPSAQCASVE